MDRVEKSGFEIPAKFLQEGQGSMLLISIHSASSLGMMSEEEKKMQRIEDIKELLS